MNANFTEKHGPVFATEYHHVHLIPSTGVLGFISNPRISAPCLENVSTFRYSYVPLNCEANLESVQGQFLALRFSTLFLKSSIASPSKQ